MRRAARLAVLAATATLLAAAALPPAAQPISREQLHWWKARHEQKLAELRHGPVDLILLGDSITQDYELAGPEPFRDFRSVWERFYAKRHTVDLGFKGDATSHLLWRIEHGELDGIAPKAAVILIGANNLGHLHWSAPDTVLGIETVVNEVRRRLPHTGIVLLSVLPSARGEWVIQTTAQINAALVERYGGGHVPGVTYVDVTGLFVKNGAIDTSLFLDPKLTPPEPALHPTPDGQARMAEAIEPTLRKLLGETY
jgi:lysophospholipase L1-like esterase